MGPEDLKDHFDWDYLDAAQVKGLMEHLEIHFRDVFGEPEEEKKPEEQPKADQERG